MISAFGVDHGTISKGAPEDAAKVLKEGLKFKPIKPGVKPTGPGSLRGKMDPSTSHWKKGISKAKKDGPGPSSGSASAGRMATAAVAAPIHGLVAGRKGSKMAAGGSQLGAGIAGGAMGRLAGAGAGALVKHPAQGAAIGSMVGGYGGVLGATEYGNRRGWYKAQGKGKS